MSPSFGWPILLCLLRRALASKEELRMISKVLYPILMILTMLAMVLGCDGEDETIAPSSTPSPELVTITIGNITDETGIYSELMSIANMALEDMVAYYNDNNLIPGVHLDVISYDTEYDPAKIFPGYDWLKEHGADIIWAPLPSQEPSPSSLIESKLIEDGILLFSQEINTSDLHQSGNNYRFGCPSRHQIFTLLDWIRENDPQFPTDHPARVGIARYADDNSKEVLTSIEEYVASAPNDAYLPWVEEYIAYFDFAWRAGAGEVLKDCDYVFVSVPMTYFIKQFESSGYTTNFISLEDNTNVLSFVTEQELWGSIDGMLFCLSHSWWTDDTLMIDLLNDLMNEKHPYQAEDIIEMGGPYLLAIDAYIMLEIIREAAKSVGPENISLQTLKNTAQSFSMSIDGCPYSFSETKRTSNDAVGIYRIDADNKTLIRADPDWVPIMTEP